MGCLRTVAYQTWPWRRVAGQISGRVEIIMVLNNGAHSFRGSEDRKAPVPAVTLKTGTVQIERKTFSFELQENIRGRLLRITEEVSGRRNSIVIPATGLVDIKRLLDSMLEAP